MATVMNWPENLASMHVSATQSDYQVGYRYADVNAGPPYVELFTRDAPTLWNISLNLDKKDSIRFRAWLAMNDYRYNPDWFTGFPVALEEGWIDQEARIIQFPQVKQQGKAFTYTFQILVRELNSLIEKEPGIYYYLAEYGISDDINKESETFSSTFLDAWPEPI